MREKTWRQTRAKVEVSALNFYTFAVTHRVLSPVAMPFTHRSAAADVRAMVGGQAAEPLRVAVLGSTGSIGKSTLDVIAASRGRLIPFLLAAHRSTAALLEQAQACRPRWVVVVDPEAAAGIGAPTAPASQLTAPSVAAATACTNCAIGRYSASGASSCSPCDAGRYAAAAQSNACTACPAGNY
jgi:hypothetical protein